jgi:hypothetical protein
MQTLTRMPDPRLEDTSFEQQCIIIEEAADVILNKYMPELRGLKRSKKDAKELLTRMKYHAKNLLFHIDKFNELLS